MKFNNYMALIAGIVAFILIILTEMTYRGTLFDAPEFKTITMIN